MKEQKITNKQINKLTNKQIRTCIKYGVIPLLSRLISNYHANYISYILVISNLGLLKYQPLAHVVYLLLKYQLL